MVFFFFYPVNTRDDKIRLENDLVEIPLNSKSTQV